MRKYLLILSYYAFCILATAQGAYAANSTVPGNLVTDPPTLTALGFAWFIDGDDNRNCSVTVEYRTQGSVTWKLGMPLFRPESRAFKWGGELANPPAVSIGNLLAGSIFDLTPNTTYEVRLTLSDPDGGTQQRTVNATTRKVPSAAVGGRTINVSPGGLQAALSSAQAGDKIILAAGTYTGSYTPTINGTEASPIVIHGTNKTSVVFDGTGNTNWIFDLSNRQHIYLENFSIIKAKKTIRGTSSTGVVLRDLILRDLPVSAGDTDKTLGPKFDRSTNAYICDNQFNGPEPDLNRARAGYGPSYNVEIGGTGNVVCHNYMEHWWDAITSADDCYASFSCIANDFYNNVIMYSTDDALELDGSLRNVRAFRNRMGSNYNGITTQPIYGGPIYIVRNEIFSNQKSTFKFNTLGGQDGGSGAVVLHNSLANYDIAIYDGYWSNFYFRNNIIYSSASYLMWTWVNDTTGNGFDFNYDSFHGGLSSTLLKFRYSDSGTTYMPYSNLADLCTRTGDECQGRWFTSSASEWVRVPEPKPMAQVMSSPYDQNAWDFTLTSGATSVDSALLIPNINDGFIGAGPDRGALERGAVAPVFGPRASAPDTIPPSAPSNLQVN